MSGCLYNQMTNKAKNHLIEMLGNRVCPYCNRNYVFSSSGVNTCQLDHFYSKSHYPILAASFYNLIPVCATCNHHKSANDFPYSPHVNKDELLQFSFTVKQANFYKNEDYIDIVVHLTDETYRSQVEKLKLEKIYQGHKDVVLDIINKHRIFSENYLQTLCREFDFLNSVQELKELIYNVPLEKEHRNDRPLSKLTQDILEEFENL